MIYHVLRSLALAACLQTILAQPASEEPVPAPVPIPSPSNEPAPAETPSMTPVPTPGSIAPELPEEFLLINWEIGVGTNVLHTVDPGTTVLWNWTDPGRTHTVTSDDILQLDEATFNSDEHLTPWTFWTTFTEEQAGQQFPYRCSVHPTAMRGIITVTGGGPPNRAQKASNSNNVLIILCALSALAALLLV